MALTSPGVEVQVIDQSQYTPTQAGSVAYVLVATAQDKQSPSGTTAIGTTAANAGKLIAVTSQRDLVNTFGSPEFQLDAAGNPIHGDERNEYGLLAAYSALGVSNGVYVQRANVDLAQLEGSSIRPTGHPADATYWLDLDTTNWGIYEYHDGGFVLQTPIVITESSKLSGSVPLSSVGAIGDYAVNATSTSNPIYYKGYTNSWSLVGSDSWKANVPAITGSIANPTTLAIGQKMVINGVNVTISGTSVADVASDIVGIDGVSARVNVAGQLEIFADSTAKSNGVDEDGKLTIEKGTTIGGTDCAELLGLFTAADGTANTKSVFGPTVAFDTYRNPPAWRSTDVTPRPQGSVWFKTSATGNGANWGVKKYSSTLGDWNLLAAPFYANDTAAIQGLDLVGGGAGLALGTTYVKYDTLSSSTGTFKPYVKTTTGILKVTGTVAGGSFSYDSTDGFLMEVSVPGSTLTQTANIQLSGTTATSLVGDILSAGLPNIVAAIETSGAISVSHLAGGTIKFTQLSGTPIVDAGLSLNNHVQNLGNGVYLASPFVALTYTYSTTAPYSNPADGRLWYYNNPLEVDILINDGTGWKGYQNGGVDARGYDLSATNATGPILSASKPVTQSDGETSLQPGDLWIDTGDLANYPTIYRYTDASTWELIDNTDQITVDGIVFADARWDADGTMDPIVDDLPAIADLLTSDNTDADCPSYELYARGTLLFNTRRSGYNVKRFESQWHANDTNPPAVLSAWVSSSGVDENGVPYFGHKAQRSIVVEAMKAAITSSTSLREEQVEFNLMCAPGYPELIQDLVTLNDDRKQTAFIIGDSPLDLSSNSTTIENWAKNTNLATDNGENGLVTTNEYLAVYYPSGLATNLDGNSVVVPASHMMLRTFIRSDNVSYPWFAPAGVHRGVIDNVSSIGYIDTADGGIFKSIGVTEGLRNKLYENRVNPLTVLPGVGLVAYGQKTRAATTSALDRINVARLVAYLRLVFTKVAAPFIFEPNDTITRNQVKSAFEAVLNDLVAKRGVYDYLVVCDTVNNTPDRIDRNELYVDIALHPVKAVEFVYIPVRLLNTGAALSIK